MNGESMGAPAPWARIRTLAGSFEYSGLVIVFIRATPVDETGRHHWQPAHIMQPMAPVLNGIEYRLQVAGQVADSGEIDRYQELI
ncbi:MAG: hypothetical protein HLX50_07050 [Alteromonadaceae bacterium]|nr:hypothetical protein [Alteromonadaceae bacterium]